MAFGCCDHRVDAHFLFLSGDEYTSTVTRSVMLVVVRVALQVAGDSRSRPRRWRAEGGGRQVVHLLT